MSLQYLGLAVQEATHEHKPRGSDHERLHRVFDRYFLQVAVAAHKCIFASAKRVLNRRRGESQTQGGRGRLTCVADGLPVLV